MGFAYRTIKTIFDTDGKELFERMGLNAVHDSNTYSSEVIRMECMVKAMILY